MTLATSADCGLLAEQRAQEIERLRRAALEAVRDAREAWLFVRAWLGPDHEGASDVCALLCRCAGELGETHDGAITARKKTEPHWRALNAWLAVDAWRRAKGGA